MDRDVIEVVARIGATMLDAVLVPRDGHYRIGTAPGVDLAVEIAPLASFPLVDGNLRIRRPAGIAMRRDGRVITESDFPIARGETVELRIGLVTITLARIAPPSLRVPPPRVERRPVGYGIASLAAHVILWAVAMASAPFERIHAPPIARLVHVHVEPPEPKPSVQRTAVAITVGHHAKTEPHGPAAVQRDEVSAASQLSTLSDEFIEAVKHVGPTYDEAAAHEKGFAGGRHFDPTGRREFGTVASAYATVGSGSGAGDSFALAGETPTPAAPVITHCRTSQCDVAGGGELAAVRGAIDKQREDLISCYRRRDTVDTAGEIILDFEIATDGKVRDARGSGLVTVGACIAELLADVAFPPSERDTHVHYTLSFRPGIEPHRSHAPWHPTRLP